MIRVERLSQAVLLGSLLMPFGACADPKSPIAAPSGTSSVAAATYTTPNIVPVLVPDPSSFEAGFDLPPPPWTA